MLFNPLWHYQRHRLETEVTFHLSGPSHLETSQSGHGMGEGMFSKLFVDSYAPKIVIYTVC